MISNWINNYVVGLPRLFQTFDAGSIQPNLQPFLASLPCLLNPMLDYLTERDIRCIRCTGAQVQAK